MTVLLDVADVSKMFPVGGGPGPLARFKRRFSGGPEKLPKVYAVDDVSFTINKGETVGLVGESGCGKSTLARVVLNLIHRDAGELIFDGEAVGTSDGITLRDLRKSAQMVFQDSHASLNPRLSIEDTLAFMFETRLVIRPTRFALETGALQRDYDSCWSGFEKLFRG